MHILIQGFMGCGKSTLGPKLAQALAYDFLDIDQVFIRTFKCSISDFIDDNGIRAFRTAERQILNAVIKYKTPHVIALGGGTLVQMQLLKTILSKCVVIYLNVPLPILQKRLRKDFLNRPLLTAPNANERVNIIKFLWMKRQKYYTLSQIEITHKTKLQVLVKRLHAFIPYTA
ncbi:MAG: shikimate kinase [Bacteroidia bacterium]